MKLSANVLQLSVALSLIVVAVLLRLLPHPANFAPAMAIAVFAGAMLPARLAVIVPLVALAISDLIIGFYPGIVVVWACYVVVALASNQWLRRPSFGRGVLLIVSASVFFFVVTNFAVWTSSGMYEHTWPGFMQCYTMALPFFRNSFLSDMLYAGLLFGCLKITQVAYGRLRFAQL